MDGRRIVGRQRGDRDHAAHAHQLHERAHLIDIWTWQTLKQARRIAIAVKRAVSTAGRSLRVYPNNRTSSAMAATSQKGQQQTQQ